MIQTGMFSETGMFSVVVGSLILLYACYSDLKSRSVANEVWLLMIAVGIPIALYNVYLSGITFLIRFGFSLFFTFLLAYLFFYLNLFGGADAKALIGIAILIPINPLNASLIVDPLPFAITTLFNAAIISLIVPPSMFFYNLRHLRSKRLSENLNLAFIGYTMRIDALAEATHKHVRALHVYEEDGDAVEGDVKRKFVFGGLDLDDDMVEQLKTYRAQGKIDEEVWVTPELPYMLFITAGFFIALFYGNLILLILTALVPL
ncbi:MAG: prepilin peptidase [Methanomicrobia archaeon]|nr:prepilin peptidase [Methanomicrobia archaeon]